MTEQSILATLEKIKSRTVKFPTEITPYDAAILIQEREMLLRVAISLEKQIQMLQKERYIFKVIKKS